MSDWYGTYGPGVISSGLDLEMPGPARWMGADRVRGALENGSIEEALVDRKVHRLLTLLDRTGARRRPQPEPERADEPQPHRKLAHRVAVESIVLLKNKSALPITSPLRIAVIGELATTTPHQGGGSSAVNPHRVVSIIEGLRASAPEGANVAWIAGANAHRDPPAFDAADVIHDISTAGFLAEYYAGPDFEGEPVRALSTEKSRFSLGGPGDGWVDYESFSLRLSGRFVASTTGRHVFSAAAVGRVQVSSGGTMVVDCWEGDASEQQLWEADLAAGDELDLVVEHGSKPNERERWLGIGCELPGPSDPIEAACALAAESDIAVVVVGLTPDWESEGFNRHNLALPGEQNRLVAEVASAQPNTVVVTVAGAALEMPWLDQAAAVVHVWYGGQEVGAAVADVLFGREDPGGRLPVTFPRDSKQHPGLLNYPGEAGKVRYGEGLYVGYRGFDRLGLEPMFSFGHGLSYTSFELGDVSIENQDATVVLSAQLSNVGPRTGTEVIQVFAKDIGDVDRRLAGFAKVPLEAGESAAVEIPISRKQLRWWNPATPGWMAATRGVEFEIRGTFGTRTVTATIGAIET